MQTGKRSPQCVLKSFNEVSARRTLPKPDIAGQRTGELRSAYKGKEFGKRYWKVTHI